MSVYDSYTIQEYVNNVVEGRVILPAMQRDFVWKKEKIYALYESLMLGYPIGTFIVWKVNSEIIKKYAFNEFVKDYVAREDVSQKRRICSNEYSEYFAVLDGQQRITAFVIGLTGSYSEKTKLKNADGTPKYTKKVLCINFLYEKQEESACEYEFRFVAEENAKNVVEDNGRHCYWMPVSEVINSTLWDILSEFEKKYEKKKGSEIVKTAELLRKVLIEKQNIYTYVAKKEKLEDVIDIFLRVNSLGQPLEASDLILSSATSCIVDEDVHDLLRRTINSINDLSNIKINKDFILTAGLMCIEAESISLGKACSRKEMLEAIFKTHWEGLVKAIREAVRLVDYVGFGKLNLTRNILCVIVYYLFKINVKDNYYKSSTERARKDRVLIRQWILRALIKKVFMDGTGATLLRIRKLILDNYKKEKLFPLDALLWGDFSRSNLKIDESNIDDLLELKYTDKRVLPVLAEIQRQVDVNNMEVDHIFSKATINQKRRFKKLYKNESNVDVNAEQDKYKRRVDCLSNLQLLEKGENCSKGDLEYKDWVKDKTEDFRVVHVLPEGEYEFKDFIKFVEKRNELLRARLERAFPASVAEILAIHGLQ